MKIINLILIGALSSTLYASDNSSLVKATVKLIKDNQEFRDKISVLEKNNSNVFLELEKNRNELESLKKEKLEHKDGLDALNKENKANNEKNMDSILVLESKIKEMSKKMEENTKSFNSKIESLNKVCLTAKCSQLNSRVDSILANFIKGE